ncbi:MAG: phosphoadenosine phosphosulfate reductase, partial [Alphaproteobacteria bacterium]|nr:phosphoadenosine phosphosulfate reductase [Alphaproteobacteria bacterium]
MKASIAETLGPRLAPLDVDHRLLLLREFIPGRIVFTTSFGIEDQLVAHSIFTQGLDIDVATIDTGRLFPETYELWERTEARYARRIRAVYPQAAPP